MKINFRQPRYIIPLIALPFVLLFFYIYTDFSAPAPASAKKAEALQDHIADVSEEVKNRTLADKLASYRQQYRRGDGYTAIGQIQDEKADSYRFDEIYNSQEKQVLDSIEKAYRSGGRVQVSPLVQPPQGAAGPEVIAPPAAAATGQGTLQDRSLDPMELFRLQMSFADSLAKASDPAAQAEEKQRKRLEELKKRSQQQAVLTVEKHHPQAGTFNTVLPQDKGSLIQAILEENITGYVDSRLKLRLMDDLLVGGHVIARGTHLYANVTGFSGQRVLLSVRSILHQNQILPVHLEVYDNDGSSGLFVPASAFRELSRELGGTTTQGINLQEQLDGDNRLLMGTIQKMFQSTTTAVSKHMRKNRAKLKYGTLVYLIDPNAQKQKKQ